MTTALETQNQRTEQRPLPEELNPYWPSRIHQDRVWYRQYVSPGERFYCPHSDTVYEISNIRNNADTFTLRPCSLAESLHASFEPAPGESHYTDNICSLAGSLEAGDLVHLDRGVLRTVGEHTFFTIGELTVKADSATSYANELLGKLDPPNGPIVEDVAKLKTALTEPPEQVALYGPHTLPSNEKQSPKSNTTRAPRAAQNVETHFIPVSPFSKWTFEDATIRKWVEDTFREGETILNACAGKVQLTPPTNGEILRNDLNNERPNTDFNVDVAELASLPELEKGCIDRVIFDPPWSLYQSNLRYQSNHVSKSGVPDIDLSSLPFETPGPDGKTQLGHAKLAKMGFDWLLSPGGEVVEITFHGTSMPHSMGYERQQRVIFDPVGEARAVIGSVDRKVRQQLQDFL